MVNLEETVVALSLWAHMAKSLAARDKESEEANRDDEGNEDSDHNESVAAVRRRRRRRKEDDDEPLDYRSLFTNLVPDRHLAYPIHSL